MHCISPSISPSNQRLPILTTEWLKLDAIVKTWIYGSITPSLLQNIYQRNLSARQAWVNLHNLFQVNKEARALQLENDLRNISLGNMSITEYCTKIKTIADLLSNIDSPVSDRNLVTYTVNGLPQRWESVPLHIRLQRPPPSWVETRAILLGEETRLLSSRHTDNNHFDTTSSPTVLQAGQHSGNRRNPRRNDHRETPPQNQQRYHYKKNDFLTRAPFGNDVCRR